MLIEQVDVAAVRSRGIVSGARTRAPRAACAVLPALLLIGTACAVEAAAPRPPAGGPARQPPAGVDAPSAPAGGWTVAVEDTLDLSDRLDLGMIEVHARRMRIGEIVDRCIRREEEQQRRIRSLSYTQSVRVTFHAGPRSGQTAIDRVIEEVSRVSEAPGAEMRTVPLRRDRYRIENGERKPWNEEDGDDGFSIGVGLHDFQGLPFYLEDRGAYDFTIRSRKVLGERLLYEVHLRPKSDFAIAPEGTIWLDTTYFQILREEFHFKNRVPFPMVLKSIGPFTRERERVGDCWVWKRFLIRIDLHTGLLRWVERDVPDRAEFVVLFEGHEVDLVPLADSSGSAPGSGSGQP